MNIAANTQTKNTDLEDLLVMLPPELDESGESLKSMTVSLRRTTLLVVAPLPRPAN
jgi:hypothetical protein